MHHAETLIARIVFLEGTPTVSRLNQIHVGAGRAEATSIGQGSRNAHE